MEEPEIDYWEAGKKWRPVYDALVPQYPNIDEIALAVLCEECESALFRESLGLTFLLLVPQLLRARQRLRYVHVWLD